MIIPISRNDTRIGQITFTPDSGDAATGSFDVFIPFHKSLENLLVKHLNTNPDELSIIGGDFPKKIGKYSDGIVNVLYHLAGEYNFEFDSSAMPLPNAPDGAVF